MVLTMRDSSVVEHSTVVDFVRYSPNSFDKIEKELVVVDVDVVGGIVIALPTAAAAVTEFVIDIVVVVAAAVGAVPLLYSHPYSMPLLHYCLPSSSS